MAESNAESESKPESEPESKPEPESKSSPKGQVVSARTEYEAKKGAGKGTIVEISAKEARIEKGDVAVEAGEQIRLKFSFFETSTPLTVDCEVPSAEKDAFLVRFTKIDPVHANMLRMIIRKLRKRTGPPTCIAALLPDGA